MRHEIITGVCTQAPHMRTHVDALARPLRGRPFLQVCLADPPSPRPCSWWQASASGPALSPCAWPARPSSRHAGAADIALLGPGVPQSISSHSSWRDPRRCAGNPQRPPRPRPLPPRPPGQLTARSTEGTPMPHALPPALPLARRPSAQRGDRQSSPSSRHSCKHEMPSRDLLLCVCGSVVPVAAFLGPVCRFSGVLVCSIATQPDQIYIRLHTHTHTHTHTCINAYIQHIYLPTYPHAYMHACIHTHTHTHTNTNTHTHTCMHVCVCVCVRACIYVCMYLTHIIFIQVLAS